MWGAEVTKVAHGAPVLAVSFDGENRHLATAGKDGRACIWEIPSGKQTTCFHHASPLVTLDFSADGRHLLTASADLIGQITTDFCARLWDVSAGRQVSAMCHTKAVTGAYLLPTADRVITGSKDGSVRVWNASSGRELRRLAKGRWEVLSTAVSRTRDLFAAATWSGIDIWNTSTLMKVWDTAASVGNISIFLHAGDSGNFLLAGNASGAVRVWDLKSGAENVVTLPFNTLKVAANPKRDYFAAGSDHGVIGLWEHLHSPSPSARPVTDDATNTTVLEFDPSGEYLVTGTEYGRLRVWRGWKSDRYVTIDHRERMEGFSFLVGQNRIVTFGGKRVALSEYGQGLPREVQSFPHPANVNALAVTEDGVWLATSSGSSVAGGVDRGDQKVRIWNTKTGSIHAEFALPANPQSVAFSASGQVMAVGTTSGEVQIRQVPTGSLVARLEELCSSSHELAFSPDNRYLGVLCDPESLDGEPLHLWPVGRRNEEPRLIDGGLLTFAFHPNGELVVGGTRRGTVVWRLNGAKVIDTFPGNDVWQLALSRDGKFIATEEDGSPFGLPVPLLRLWAFPSGREIGQIKNQYTVPGFQFSANGRFLGLPDDGKLVLFPWNSKDLAYLACSLIRRDLTEQEWQQYLPGEKYRPTCSGRQVPHNERRPADCVHSSGRQYRP